MNEMSFAEKMVEQGFVVAGIGIALVFLVIVWRQATSDRKEYASLTREVVSAMSKNASTNEQLSNVLDKNLERLDGVATKEDIVQLRDFAKSQHESTRRLMRSVKKDEV